MVDERIDHLKRDIEKNLKSYTEWEIFFRAHTFDELPQFDQILIITNKCEILKLCDTPKVVVKKKVLLSPELVEKINSLQVRDSGTENANPANNRAFPKSRKRPFQEQINTERKQKFKQHL